MRLPNSMSGMNVEVVYVDDGPDMCDVIRSILGGWGVPRSIEFRSADYEKFNFVDSLPREEKIRLHEIALRHFDHRGNVIKDYDGKPLENVLEEMVHRETTLSHDHGLYCVSGSTRAALNTLFDHTAPESGDAIALPLPNWHFWEDNPLRRFEYFEAPSEDELVSNFKRAAKKRHVKGVVISAPNTLVDYELSEASVKEIDSIAERNNVKIIVDDVMRGTRSIGQRDSIGCWINRPFIAEGLSHRFSKRSFGRVSYVMVPKGENLRNTPEIPKIERLYAPSVEAVLKYSSQAAVDELTARNNAFEKGFKASAPKDVQTYRPFSSCLTTRVEIPRNFKCGPEDLSIHLWNEFGIGILPAQEFYPKRHRAHKKCRNLLRASIGQIHSERMEESAALLGAHLSLYK